MNKRWTLSAVVALMPVNAVLTGVYTDDMAKCLVASTKQEDQQALACWVFTTLARHPSVSPSANIKPVDAEQTSKTVGGLFMHLMAETCAAKTKNAVRYEGAASIEQAVNVLGQVAARELMSHPDVVGVLSNLVKHLAVLAVELCSDAQVQMHRDRFVGVGAAKLAEVLQRIAPSSAPGSNTGSRP